MREIKFRAYDTKEKTMVDISEDEYQLYVMAQGNVVVRQSQFFASSNRFVLMQYTDSKDKNGTEIYEGDLFKYGGELYEVKFGESWQGNGFYMYSFKQKEDVSMSWGMAWHWEIIGNIYENPDLLTSIQ